MNRKTNYERSKGILLSNQQICPENRQLWEKFFVWQERKLKRINNLSRLDDSAYKTLSSYLTRFRNVNKWFNNKPWIDLTREDIQKVYDDLEDGVIKNKYGKGYADRKSYYTKIFKSKPFEMAGKSEIANEVFEFYRPKEDNEVNYIEYDDFMKITTAANSIAQKLLLWLAWDIGENVGSLLQLKKSDFRGQLNPDTNEPEYLVDLRKEILKRSRRPRVEITNFTQTAQLLDIMLANIEPGERLFNFGHRQALKFMAKCTNMVDVKCSPSGKRPTYKDLRSSMCCYLLKIGWRIEEVNSRLGHSPANLSMVTRYANYLALDRHHCKKKVSDNKIQDMQKILETSQQREKLLSSRLEEHQKRIEILEDDRHKTNEFIRELANKLSELQSRMSSQDIISLREIFPAGSADYQGQSSL